MIYNIILIIIGSSLIFIFLYYLFQDKKDKIILKTSLFISGFFIITIGSYPLIEDTLTLISFYI